MADYARAAVRRYGPNGSLWRENPVARSMPIRSWQIWNEPNLGIYWCNRQNAREYASMLRVVGKAIKSEDPGAEIVTAGLPDSKLKSAMPLARFLTRLYRARGKRYFDTLAINSYAKNNAELSQLLRRTRRHMNRRRDGRARIWVTEIGWGDAGPAHRFIVGPEGQAVRIERSFSLLGRLRTRLRLRGVVIDVAALDVIYSFVARALRAIVLTAKLRGADTVIVGIQPDVAIAMVQFRLNLEPLRVALDLDEAVAMLDGLTREGTADGR